MQSAIAGALWGVLAAIFSTVSLAQAYPAKPVRLVTPYPPGGGVDAAARIIGQALSEEMKQQFVIDNRGGASGQIGTEVAARAVPDGYSLLLGSVGPNAILPSSGIKLPYDALNDFAPVSLVAMSEYALTVHPSLPVRTVKDLIALAKAQPGQIGFGSTGVAGGPHLAGELLDSLTGIRMTHVPYKGGGPVTAALLSGEVSVSFSSLPTVLPQHRAGRLRIIAVTGPKRSAGIPDIPAVAETVPGYEVTQWYGILAPAKTDPAIVQALHSAIEKAAANERVKDQFAKNGALAVSTTPQAFTALIQREIGKWTKVFRSSSIKLE